MRGEGERDRKIKILFRFLFFLGGSRECTLERANFLWLAIVWTLLKLAQTEVKGLSKISVDRFRREINVLEGKNASQFV